MTGTSEQLVSCPARRFSDMGSGWQLDLLGDALDLPNRAFPGNVRLRKGS
jgi:hypothetical protein